jgi:HisA/HisF family protein
VEVIPVIDLLDGLVVHARFGRRDEYRPIETGLSPTSDPIDVARGLLSLHPFRTLYVADLDAIEGKGDNHRVLARLKAALPGLVLWVDNGISDAVRADAWLATGLGVLVLGSETQRDADLARHMAADGRVVLSLDFRGDTLRGPQDLLSDPTAWPQKLIAMTLARVGSRSGPDMARLSQLLTAAPDRSIYAAGGVRHLDDLQALARAGTSGALVASSLHDGRLTGADIAKL